MNLINATTWAKENFIKGSIPTKRRLIEWVERGHIDGAIIGNYVYVNTNALLTCQKQQSQEPASPYNDIDADVMQIARQLV